ncbi:YraN family protein [Veronia nyctiphanis]|uniref:UPF0102 protein CS022_18645 n=1 Tax=Veronia nyctiphanis TaxID=1278244 RepID=A0A4Q0YN65_9GAMM|nr:YraN family protein [Veronia nyctiphanis]RXJ71903.1 YraN family protein [Veronia nyctiphanis]
MLPWNKKQAGDHFEQQARNYLSQRGLKFLAKNARCKQGEIDLIMQDGECTVFIEVKFRKTNTFGGAAYAIGEKKKARLFAAAEFWLCQQGKNSAHTEFRFDAVTFEGDVSSVNWIKNIEIKGF